MTDLETKMRDEPIPYPGTQEELNAYIADQVAQNHTYDTCVYAMRNAAVASFNYVAGKLGVSGFQASCADMSILTQTRGIKGAWMMIRLEDSLYPQYNTLQSVKDFLVSDESQKWLKEQAQKKLSEIQDGDVISDKVRAHWEMLAKKDLS